MFRELVGPRNGRVIGGKTPAWEPVRIGAEENEALGKSRVSHRAASYGIRPLGCLGPEGGWRREAVERLREIIRS
jgi:hypothetical protein